MCMFSICVYVCLYTYVFAIALPQSSNTLMKTSGTLILVSKHHCI